LSGTAQGEKCLPAKQVFALTVIIPTLRHRELGVKLVRNEKAAQNPETLESNVPGVYLAGRCYRWTPTVRFSSRRRFHGKQIVNALKF